MSFCSKVCDAVFEYDTPKIVHIKSKKVGIVNRLIQLLIIGYIIGFVIIYKKGYQETSPIQSAAITKLKGVTFTNFTDDEFNPAIPNRTMYNRIWDVADFVVPPDLNDAFFVTTNLIITPQKRGICNENALEVPQAQCDPENHNCTEGEPFLIGNGVQTGRCTKTTPYMSKTNYSCEIKAWCNVEMDTEPLLDKKKAILDGASEFTVLIKNTVIFTKFGIMRRNVAEHVNSSYLKGCTYDRDTDPLCPIFKLGHIAKMANDGTDMDFSAMAVKGGVIGISISWNCNLDYSVEYCNPVYSFKRLDDPQAKIAKGWNFRYAHYSSYDTRTLFKAYGIKFVLTVQAKAGKFSIIPLLLNIASGLALLGITVVICDFIVLHLLKKRQYYQDNKYQMVEAADQDFEHLFESK